MTDSIEFPNNNWLGTENLDEVSLHVANRANRKIFAAFKTADLVTTWGDHTVNWIIITDDTLCRFS